MFPLPWNKAYRKKDGSLTTIDDAISEGGGGDPYTLPTASAETKGGIKIGRGLVMDGEVLNAQGGGSSGGIKVFTFENTSAMSPGNDEYLFGNTLSSFGMESGDTLIAIESANNALINLRATDVSGGPGKAYKDLLPTDTIYIYGKCVNAVNGTTSKACLNFIYKTT